MAAVHELLLCRCSTGAFLGFENHTDERLDAREASDVRRGDLLHEAKDQSFRYRKDLGLPNQVCLFRQRLYSVAVSYPQQTGLRPTPNGIMAAQA